MTQLPPFPSLTCHDLTLYVQTLLCLLHLCVNGFRVVGGDSELSPENTILSVHVKLENTTATGQQEGVDEHGGEVQSFHKGGIDYF